MPISDVIGYESGHFGRVYEHLIKPAVIAAGFDPIRADDTNKTDYIVVSIIKRVVESEMVLCDYSARNPNVMYELGIRHAFNLPVVLIKDRQTDKVFDIQGLRYTDYDETLRIDSVQKDTNRITKSINETSTEDKGSYNSVVQLAGLTAAIVPDKQQVSPDTQLLLSAIASVESRINNQTQNRSGINYLNFSGEQVIFSDLTDAEIGDYIHDLKTNFSGELIDMHPSSGEIFIKDQTGVVQQYSAVSLKSRYLTNMPF